MKDTENRPPSRKRRKWGSVIVRRDADGNPASFQARYVNPLDPPKKVGRNFGLEYETEAYKWCVLSSCYRPVWREFSFRKSGRF